MNDSGVVIPSTPLSSTDVRAGLRAVGRILQMARSRVFDTDADAVADLLGTASRLNELITRPADFRDSFRDTLRELAIRHDGLDDVVADFDRDTAPLAPYFPATPRDVHRRVDSEEEKMWLDWGGSD